jgi:2-dehydropantoate 2-reductase
MRQIPKYLIIGSGRLSNHLAHYFTLSNVAFNVWQRSNNNFDELVSISDVIILAINDDAIAAFIEQHPIIRNKILVHCSGSLSLNDAIGLHPLMSFAKELYSHRSYKEIPFVIDCKVEDFRNIFPQLENKVYVISKSQKAYYHALCVMSGNFATILWSKLFKELESTFNIPHEAAFFYLDAITRNLVTDYTSALSGPLVRNDTATINKNLDALRDDNFLPIYKAFLISWSKNNEYQ